MKTISLLFALALALVIGTAPAHAAGVGETCAGIGGIQCDAGLACQFPVGQCGTADLGGKCVKTTDPCPTGGTQVCGCNGTTYANDCELMKAGIAPDHPGACTKGKGKPKPAAKRRS